ncbi:hypothetical protein MPTK1_5g22020 [Marchantia polymorpha subsp. ruderalis]|nr:hypothetical protein MARPO_0194s0008 [Marchantia polymorpha]BBN12677.1 hypothetical protein Mp_5g22020 [Marchantia polymorpha subsp. ruderalis]|eukprot:PTQ27530.1 hypothetical protein MARPO_0194s0008 [Marchantia polymorpha]
MGRQKTVVPSLVGSLLLNFTVLTWAATFNITSIFDEFPDFSIFNQLLTDTRVAGEINRRQGVTVLAPSNEAMTDFRSANPALEGDRVANLLRYHVLLDFLTIQNLQRLDIANYTRVGTLFRTTGPANADDASVNLYNTPSNIFIGSSAVDSSQNSTVISTVFLQPSDVSVIMIDRTLQPVGFETPRGAANITGTLQDLGGYSIFVSLLTQTGVDVVFGGRQSGEGITIFVPTDEAFNKLPGQWFEAFELKEQKLLLEYHALTRYNSLDALWRYRDKQVPTVSSTVQEGPDAFNLLVTANKGLVTIHSSTPDKPVATLQSTLFDASPLVLYSIDEVLLPVELFGDVMAVPLTPPAPPPAPACAAAPAPAPSPAPPPPVKPKPKRPVPPAPPSPPIASSAGADSPLGSLPLALLLTAVLRFSLRL